ncbi:probable lysyl endopeptidase at N-terminal half [Coccomyxa sp. Obi]|nr:probable lysyl endopeptidase at N-terminal half [Coccomyxa sp. Obi]
MHGSTAFIAVALLLCCYFAHQGVAGVSLSRPVPREEWRGVPTLKLELADQHAFLDRHGSKVGLHARNIRSIAAPDFKEQDLLEAGAWQEVDGVGHVWRLAVQSYGADSHILIFSKVQLPEGSALRLYSKEQFLSDSSCGRDCQQYTSKDIDISGRLVVPAIAGEEVILEYVQPGAMSASMRPLLRLASILQGFKDSLAEVAQRRRRQARRLTAVPPQPAQPAGQAPAIDPAAALGPAPPQQAQGTQFNVDQMQKTTDGVSQCTPSVECATSWIQEAAAVVDIYAIDMLLGAMGLCTGTIVNAPLGKKYLITADHCFIDKVDISNFQWWLLIFNYEIPCRSKNKPPPIRQVIQGTKLLFYDSKSDVLLLDIPTAIPDKFQAYKLGFDASDAVPSRAVAIHHPAGNIKRISYANSTDSISTRFQPPTFSEDVHPTNQTHFQVTWTQGATQSGSSGAALIDANSRKLVGILTGGTTTCDIFSGADYFGKLSVAWQNGLENFLSDAPSLTDEGPAGLSTVTQYASGVVVVDELEGAPVAQHGPAINFWPSVFVMGPANFTRIAFYLTDPPASNEVIQATVSIKGDLPGNQINPAPFVKLFPNTFNFTTDNCCTVAQPLVIETGLGPNVPGDLLRLQIVFWLTSSTNTSYLHVSAVKGIIQSGYSGWTSVQPVACMTAPCYFKEPILAKAPPSSPLPTKAVFRFAPETDTAVAQDVCLHDGFLDLATVSVYINGTFAWTLSQAIDNSDCVHIPALDVPAGVALNTVISDNDDYEAVLPLGAVKSVSIYQAAKPPAAAQDRPASAAAIVAAVIAQWQRASSAPPPSLPAVAPGAAAFLASPAPAAAPSITPGAVQRGAPVNPAPSGESSTGAVAASLAAAGSAGPPSVAPGPVQNGAPIYTGAWSSAGAMTARFVGPAAAPGGGPGPVLQGVSGGSSGTSMQSGRSSMVGSMAQGGNASGQVAAASTSGNRNPFGGEKTGQVQVSQAPSGSAGQSSSLLGNQGGTGGVDLPPYPNYG